MLNAQSGIKEVVFMAMIRKIKQKIKNIVNKSKKIKTPKKPAKKLLSSTLKKAVKKVFVSKAAKPQVTEKREFLGSQQVAVEKAKFYSPTAPRVSRPMPQDLPGGYGEDKLVLQVRDPWWMYTYWEVTFDTWNRLRERLGDVFERAKKVLRVYDISQVDFNGRNAHRFFDLEVRPDANSWYIDSGSPGRSWCVDFGLKLPNGEFITIIRSNIAHTPLDGPSWITDEEWMIPDEMFARLYGMGFGFGQSSPVGKAWAQRFKQALFSGALASPGMASMASPVKKVPKQRKFWLVVDCELIVYGATEPDAKVTVQGKEIKLRPDGTFTFRYALPDGKQVIPVVAISSDDLEERTITPIVSRETKSSTLLKEAVAK